MAENVETKRSAVPDAGVSGGRATRLCAVTRTEAAPEALIRFVKGPDGGLVPDLALKLPGRGVWVSCARDTLEKAIKTNAFARSLHAEVAVPPGLADRVDELLERRVLEALALANKAGAVICGFEKVDAALDKGRVHVLLHGSDAAADGRARLDRKFRAISKEKGLQSPIIDILTTGQLSLAMGRTSVVHAALISGGLAQRLFREAGRLERFRSASAAGQVFSAAT